jgi:hypothetical protein
MGAGYAGKNLSSDKAMHANEVLTAFNDYKMTLSEKEREETDATLFEFKRKVKSAASLSLRKGKDISQSLAKLNDADLETMRQYINKLLMEGPMESAPQIPINATNDNTGTANTASSSSANIKSGGVIGATNSHHNGVNNDDPLLQQIEEEEDPSVQWVEDDILEEALDTFDALEVSTQSASGIPTMHVVDLEASASGANEIETTTEAKAAASVGDDVTTVQDQSWNGSSPTAARGSKQASPAVSTSSVDTDGSPTGALGDTIPGHPHSTPQQQRQPQHRTKNATGSGSNGGGFSMLNDMTTSPASPLKPVHSSGNGGRSNNLERMESKASTKSSPSIGRKDQGLSERISSWREDRPVIQAKETIPISQIKRSQFIDALDSSYDSDTMPSDLVMDEKKNAQRQEYMDPGEIIDAKNETLMGLQRQKVWSYAKNAQLQREVDVLQQQLRQIEVMEAALGGPSATKIPPLGSITATISGQKEAKFASGQKNNHIDNSQGWVEGQNDQQYPGGQRRMRKSPTGHNNSNGGTNTDSNTSYGPSGQNPNNSGRGAGGRGNRRVPRRRPIATVDSMTSLDSDDVSVGSQQYPQQPRGPRGPRNEATGPRGEAWQKNQYEESKSNTGNDKPIRSNSDADDSHALQDNLNHASRPFQSNDSNIQEQNRSQQLKRRVPGQRLRPDIQQNSEQQQKQSASDVQRSPSEGHSNTNGSPNKGKKAQRGVRRNTHDPQAGSPVQHQLRAAPQALPPLRAGDSASSIANSNANSSNVGANSDQDDNSVGSQQSLRRKHGKNVLRNANRRRRNTIESVGLADNESAPLQRLPEERSTPSKNPSELKPLKPLNDDTPSRPAVRKPNRRIRQPPKVDSDDHSVGSKTAQNLPLNVDYSEESEREDSKISDRENNAGPVEPRQQPRKVRPIAGRRKSAENPQQIKEQKLKEMRAEKAVQREERRKRVVEQQAKQEEEEEALFSGKAWSRQLHSGWSEVELLLQRPIEREDDLVYTVAAAEAGIMFTDQLSSAAKSLGVLRGTLSRWLLPYDNNTRLDEQASTAHGVIDSMPDEFRGKLTERQVHYLVAGANSVRKLVRIKIADDNDLEQARQALKTAIEFFKRLQECSAQHNMTPFELLSARVR